MAKSTQARLYAPSHSRQVFGYVRGGCGCAVAAARSEKESRTRQLDLALSNKLTFITARSLVHKPGAGYYRERTEQTCWHALCEDIGQMCKGIGIKI